MFRCVESKYGFSADPLPSDDSLQIYYKNLYYQSATGPYRKEYDDSELTYFDIRAQIILKVSASVGVSEGCVLDLGCGEGFFLRRACAEGFDVWGVDSSSYGLEQQNSWLLRDGRFHMGNILSDRAFPGKKFDLILCRNVMEHVVDPDQLMCLIYDYLSVNGIAVVEVPNDYSPLHNYVFNNVNREKLPFFCPPQHLHYFNTNSLKELVQRSGMNLLDFFSDYPIDHLLMAEKFNYYKNKDLGMHAHLLRKNYMKFINGLPPDKMIGLLRATYEAGLGRDIAVVFKL